MVVRNAAQCISQRSFSTLKTKVSSSENTGPAHRIPWQHTFNTRYLLKRYTEAPKTMPALVYAYTDDLQIVKPYVLNMKTNIGRSHRRTTLHKFMMETSRIPLPDAYKSQFLHKQLESGRILVDGKVMPGDKMLLKSTSITAKRHHHEYPVPRCEVPVTRHSRALSFVDKPAGLPCLPDMRRFLYNTLQFMLHDQLPKNSQLFNDLDLSSGVVMVCGSVKAGAQLARLHHKIRYLYLARVYGRMESTKLNLTADDAGNQATIEKLGYDINTDTTLVRVECQGGDVTQIRHALAASAHPIVNDWRHLRDRGAYIRDTLQVDFGRRIDALFPSRRLLRSAQQPGGYYMWDPLTSSDYVVKPSHLKLSPKLSQYYNQYMRVTAKHERVESCANCMTHRLPLPVHLMSPQLHLSEVEGPGWTFQSKIQCPWL